MILVTLYQNNVLLGSLRPDSRNDIPGTLNAIYNGKGYRGPSPIGPADPAAIVKVNRAGHITLYLNNLDHNNTVAVLKERGWTIQQVKRLFTRFSYIESGVLHTVVCETDGALYQKMSKSNSVTKSQTLRRRDAQIRAAALLGIKRRHLP